MEILKDWGFAVVWGVFALVWIAKARGTNADAQREPAVSRLVHLSLIGAGLALIFWRSSPASDALFLAGLAIAAAGVAFMIWARQHLGLYWSGIITLKEGHRLIRTGPYRFVRHPIYTGFVTAIAGSGIAQGNLRGLCAIALVVAAYVRKIGLEEKALEQQFGDEYVQFRRETRALIPFVY